MLCSPPHPTLRMDVVPEPHSPIPRRSYELPIRETHFSTAPLHTGHSTSTATQAGNGSVPITTQVWRNWNYRECRSAYCRNQHICISKKKMCVRRIASTSRRPAFARLSPYAWCVCILHSLPSGAHCVATPLIFALFCANPSAVRSPPTACLHYFGMCSQIGRAHV